MPMDPHLEARIEAFVAALTARADQSGNMFDGTVPCTLELTLKQVDYAVVLAQNRLSQRRKTINSVTLMDYSNFPATIVVLGHEAPAPVLRTCFQNQTQASQYKWSLEPPDHQGSRDPTRPVTEEQKRVVVGLLKHAVCSMVRPTDYMGRDTLRLFTGEVDPRLVEANCWDLLEWAMARSARSTLAPLFSSNAWHANRPARQNFAQLVDRIVHVLISKKSVAQRLLDPPFLSFLVQNPELFLLPPTTTYPQHSTHQPANSGNSTHHTQPSVQPVYPEQDSQTFDPFTTGTRYPTNWNPLPVHNPASAMYNADVATFHPSHLGFVPSLRSNVTATDPPGQPSHSTPRPSLSLNQGLQPGARRNTTTQFPQGFGRSPEGVRDLHVAQGPTTSWSRHIDPRLFDSGRAQADIVVSSGAPMQAHPTQRRAEKNNSKRDETQGDDEPIEERVQIKQERPEEEEQWGVNPALPGLENTAFMDLLFGDDDGTGLW